MFHLMNLQVEASLLRTRFMPKIIGLTKLRLQTYSVRSSNHTKYSKRTRVESSMKMSTSI
jgi:hypothetical protein